MSTNQVNNQQLQPATPKFEEKTVDQVLSRIAQFQTVGDLRLPPNYSAENAVRTAWLILQETKDRNDKPVLEVCTRESIANALLEMVLKGLSPVKKQCYFIAYGSKLELEESYIGTIAIAKREAGVDEPFANIVYEGDVFEYEIDTATGRKKITKHEQKFENINPDKIRGAYAVVNFVDGSSNVEIMTMPQIRLAWAQGAARGNSPAHKNFPDQMAAKTVIGRALKIAIGSSDDSALFAGSGDQVTASVQAEIKENANKKEIGFNEPIVISSPEENSNKEDKGEKPDWA